MTFSSSSAFGQKCGLWWLFGFMVRHERILSVWGHQLFSETSVVAFIYSLFLDIRLLNLNDKPILQQTMHHTTTKLGWPKQPTKLPENSWILQKITRRISRKGAKECKCAIDIGWETHQRNLFFREKRYRKWLLQWNLEGKVRVLEAYFRLHGPSIHWSWFYRWFLNMDKICIKKF